MKASVIAVIVFVLLVVFSVYFVVYAQSISPTKSETQTLMSYSTKGNYGFVATLTPNVLYNSTTISNGQGTLFVNLTKSIEVTSNYTISSDNAASYSLNSSYYVLLIGSTWNKTIYKITPALTVAAENKSIALQESFFLNMTYIEKLVSEIQKETQIGSEGYVIQILPVITGTVEYSGLEGEINYNHPLNLSASSSLAGTINPTSLSYVTSGSLTQDISVKDNSVLLEQDESYAILGLSLVGLVISLWLFQRPSTSTRRTLSDSIGEYGELITETSTPPPTGALEMKSIKGSGEGCGHLG